MKTNKNHNNHKHLSKALRPRCPQRPCSVEMQAEEAGKGLPPESPQVASSEHSDLCWALCCSCVSSAASTFRQKSRLVFPPTARLSCVGLVRGGRGLHFIKHL